MSSSDFRFDEGGDNLPLGQVLELYQALGWTAYTRDPEALLRAIRQSTFVVHCWHQDCLVGLARSLSDDVSVHFLQDILVLPQHQREGLGRALLERCLQRFSHVSRHLLLTDDEVRQSRFYRSLGFQALGDFPSLRVFLREGRTGAHEGG